MKKTLLFLTIIALVMFILGGCDNRAEQITKVDISTLNVPDSFNYETIRTVELSLHGLYKEDVVVFTPDGAELFRGQMDPVLGIDTKISLPSKDHNVVINYMGQSTPLEVPMSDTVIYTFAEIE